MLENLADTLSFGLTALILVVVGNLIFRDVKGGIHIPLFGSGYVSKALGFIAFLLSTFIIGWAFPKLQKWFRSMMVQTPFMMVVVPFIIYFMFNMMFYKS